MGVTSTATVGPKLPPPSCRLHSPAAPISTTADGSFSSACACSANNSRAATNPIVVPHLITRPHPSPLVMTASPVEIMGCAANPRNPSQDALGIETDPLSAIL